MAGVLSQARASRWSGCSGQRLDSLDALAKAAELVPRLGLGGDDEMVLRTEAIACMALTDLRIVKEWKRPPTVISVPSVSHPIWSATPGPIPKVEHYRSTRCRRRRNRQFAENGAKLTCRSSVPTENSCAFVSERKMGIPWMSGISLNRRSCITS